MVEQYHRGIAVIALLIIPATIKIIERLFAVARDHYFVSQVVLGEAGKRKLHILWVILD